MATASHLATLAIASADDSTRSSCTRGTAPVGWMKRARDYLVGETLPAMTDKERAARDRAEAVVRKGLQAADAVKEAGRALSQLRTNEWWRDTHDSWSEYVQGKFGITARRAHQLCEFAAFTDEVARAIGTTGTDVTMTERSLRPLADVEPEEVPAVVADAVAASGGKQPTPAAVRRAVASRRKGSKGKPAAKVPKPRTIRVGGAKVVLVPMAAEPAFRGWRATLVAALAKLDAEDAGSQEADAA